jgi:adenine phosphoribosyltransferase
MQEIKNAIRDIADFPKPGIIFKDITPLLADPVLFVKTIDLLRLHYRDRKPDVVVGIEARGFIFASALAYALECGLALVRKPGKLPYKTVRQAYTLEYGADAVEIHADAIRPGQNVLVMDDVLATGGTLCAVIDLLKNHFRAGRVEAACVIELDFLNGRKKLKDTPFHALIHY